MGASPEKEARFLALKKEAEGKFGAGKGSRFMWHGSDVFNWHAIARTGLKNMSNTKYMSAGAALGAGIYFANDMAYSLNYARAQKGWPKSKISGGEREPGMRCIALCEIVRGHTTSTNSGYGGKAVCSDKVGEEDVWVVQNEDAIIPRFLLAWSGRGSVLANGFQGQASQLKFPDGALRKKRVLQTVSKSDA